jgi:protein-disulfide isomerase
VAGAIPDPASQTLTITGSGFGPRPFVTLNLVPLSVQFALDTRIVATAPIDLMPPGTYLLTVSRGPSPADSGSLDVTLGAVAPPSSPPDLNIQDVAPGFGTPDQVAAKAGDRAISLAEVDREWRRADPTSYLAASRRLYEIRRRMVDKLVADELLAREAAARGVTVDALLAEELPKRTVAAPDAAAASLYQSLGDTTRGASFEQMQPALRAWLPRFTEPELARMNYVEELTRVSARAEVFLTPPRIEVERTPQDAVLGPASAAVEIVAFGDLRNGRYAAFARAFGRVRETFGDRVRLVFKNLPAIDGDSSAAAEAGQCAHAQGKFWPFHDIVLTLPGPLGPTRLKESAGKAGLDRDRFDACVDRGEFRVAIQQAIAEAARYDVQASPSFLVNGRLAPDPPAFLPPFEFFTRLIEEELARQRTVR